LGASSEREVMKKVIVGYDTGVISNSIIFEPERPSLRSKIDPHYEIVSYGPFQDFQWHIRTPLRLENKVFAVFNPNLLRWENTLTKEEFLLRIREIYSSDLELFLFYPEALDGKLPDEYNKP
jgi:hypothetical protein